MHKQTFKKFSDKGEIIGKWAFVLKVNTLQVFKTIVSFLLVLMYLTGVQSVRIDVGKEEVLVESALTSAEVQALIESTGRRAVLKGIGGSERGEATQTATAADVEVWQLLQRFP